MVLQCRWPQGCSRELLPVADSSGVLLGNYSLPWPHSRDKYFNHFDLFKFTAGQNKHVNMCCFFFLKLTSYTKRLCGSKTPRSGAGRTLAFRPVRSFALLQPTATRRGSEPLRSGLTRGPRTSLLSICVKATYAEQYVLYYWGKTAWKIVWVTPCFLRKAHGGAVPRAPGTSSPGVTENKSQSGQWYSAENSTAQKSFPAFWEALYLPAVNKLVPFLCVWTKPSCMYFKFWNDN